MPVIPRIFNEFLRSCAREQLIWKTLLAWGGPLQYTARLMNIFLAIFVYLVMAAILVVGVVLAVKGSFWLLILGLIALVLGVTKIAILHH